MTILRLKDLISYELISVTPRFQIEEAAEGTGGGCGATILDEQFGAFLRRKLGNHQNTLLTDQRLESATRYFAENIRHTFNPYEDGCEDMLAIPFPAPDVPEVDVRSNYLYLSKLYRVRAILLIFTDANLKEFSSKCSIKFLLSSEGNCEVS